ncbi:VOC family protein [Cellulomonas cellasea]|uniref:Putative phosphoglycerate mutase n=1 Tax=Cellulomonas cellasea TaxID=43670 RepID=A0A7W4UEY4_9CELL|nr:VOC family protein [Cellulomonas cellasea]MBB2922965.1 putative phosphoglycerate mutase [Cellulomonas cellasea]
MTRGALHHVELWVTDLAASEATLGRLLLRLGYAESRRWATGVRYDLGETYLVLEAGPDVGGSHERTRAGLNHLAFDAGTPEEVDALMQAAVADGWTLLFPERHPFAGGSEHRAAYLADDSGFEVELVASTAGAPAPGVVAGDDAGRKP